MGKILIPPGIIKRLKRIFTGKYIEDSDTASQNINKGKFVIWKNKLHQAQSNISSGDTLSNTNLGTEIQDGGLNSINDKLTPEALSVTLKTGFSVESWGYARASKIGKIVILSFSGLISSSTISNDTNLCEIDGIQAFEDMIGIIRSNDSGANGMIMSIKNSNIIKINKVSANAMCFGELIFPIK